LQKNLLFGVNPATSGNPRIFDKQETYAKYTRASSAKIPIPGSLPAASVLHPAENPLS